MNLSIRCDDFRLDFAIAGVAFLLKKPTQKGCQLFIVNSMSLSEKKRDIDVESSVPMHGR